MDAFFPYRATSEGVTVRVAASFLPEQSEVENGRWFWAYHIRIENHRDGPVRLLTRRWIITDGRGAVHHVEGEGVVGEQPLIAPGKAHDYVSGCPLNTNKGSMVGSFGMIGASNELFDVQIPRFLLETPTVRS